MKITASNANMLVLVLLVLLSTLPPCHGIFSPNKDVAMKQPNLGRDNVVGKRMHNPAETEKIYDLREIANIRKKRHNRAFAERNAHRLSKGNGFNYGFSGGKDDIYDTFPIFITFDGET